MAFLRQIWTLTVKNLLITLFRPYISTPLRAFWLPVIFIAFLSFARNLFIPPSKFGIADPTALRTLPEALNAVSGGRDKVVFVNNGFTDGAIDRVIAQIAEPVRSSGMTVDILESPDKLSDTCRSTLRGSSPCVAAAVFYSSPEEGPGGEWNYTIRGDRALGSKIVTTKSDNDAQIYILPFQHAVDFAIASVSGTDAPLPDKIMEYPYTSETAEERTNNIRVRYMGAIIDILSVAFFIGTVGVAYQLTGLVASERELGMSQLIDCMMPNTARWQPQAARFIAAHLALDIVYAPGWIVMGIVLKVAVFSKTSAGIQIIFQLLAGLAMSSFSLFGAAFFKKAQLSGIAAVIACLLLGIISQMVTAKSSAAVGLLGFLFPPMTYVYFTIFMARWERQDMATNLVKAAPESPWALPGIALWVFLIIQIIVYPILGALVERALYSTSSDSRKLTRSDATSTALSLNGFTKQFTPNWWYKNIAPIFGSRRQTVLAVDDLNLNVERGGIMVLLGANGSGKSTTLDAISGLSKVTAGEIMVNYPEGTGGFGLCPQKNVLWDKLTVTEHIKIFNKLKAGKNTASQEEILELIKACDLEKKSKAYSRTLSGGQKRKLQLAVMFTGGSSICCVDEVSSGLDPISRRVIWDILLGERGKRTILLTTHFLDEADLLADHIAILSRGVLKAEGSSVELKNKLGSGYRIHVYHVPGSEKSLLPQFPGVRSEIHYDSTMYHVSDSSQAAELVMKLENQGIKEYRVSGPTIEDVFLKVAEEVQSGADALEEDESVKDMKEDVKSAPQLLPGKRIGMPLQAWILFCKRATILRRNWLPYLAAFIIPIIAAGLVTLFLKDFKRPGCSGSEAVKQYAAELSLSDFDFDLVMGPASKLTAASLRNLASAFSGGSSSGLDSSALMEQVHIVDTLKEFNDYINTNFRNVTPGGFFLGDDSSPPTFAWKGDGGIFSSFLTQNTMNMLLTNVSISSQYQNFDIPWSDSSGDSLQLITYFGLAMAVYPAFFALYPTIERLRNVRALHYSNGVRSLPLWLAYVSFDFLIVLAVSVLAVAIYRGASDAWYNPGYLFVVFFLYGLSSTLFAYIVSILANSQLAAFAFAAGGQAVMFLLYFIAYMCVLTYAPADRMDMLINVVHFTIAAISPMANLTRSMFISLNTFSILCKDKEVKSYPGEITLYGGPILYLIIQTFVLFGLLLWWDSGPLFRRIKAKLKSEDDEDIVDAADADVNNELSRVTSSNDGLRVLHLSKSFGKFDAVQDVTFGVSRGEVFALLGPNGAGKSTTISLIRGDIQPSKQGGEILVEN
ncbi:hypothetical protein AJ80_07677, partial [Polytolypa hystricis UAMH7299]